MKTEWDYTNLAQSYLKRPDYAGEAIDNMIKAVGLSPGDPVCDVGAGVAHLTLMLAKRGFAVTAVEPNDAMRALGSQRTALMRDVRWTEGTGEATGCENDTYALVSFGSSFNVTDRQAALAESWRILRPQGSFTCMWNHRDLDDPVQQAIESAIRRHVPEYSYGTRREDQTSIIESSRLFKDIQYFEGCVVHHQEAEDCIEAWRSHATLARQANGSFKAVLKEIAEIVHGIPEPTIAIPYTTRVWTAKVIK